MSFTGDPSTARKTVTGRRREWALSALVAVTEIRRHPKRMLHYWSGRPKPAAPTTRKSASRNLPVGEKNLPLQSLVNIYMRLVLNDTQSLASSKTRTGCLPHAAMPRGPCAMATCHAATQLCFYLQRWACSDRVASVGVRGCRRGIRAAALTRWRAASSLSSRRRPPPCRVALPRPRTATCSPAFACPHQRAA